MTMPSLSTVDEFHLAYWKGRGWDRISYLGFPIKQCPLDMHVYQEVIFKLRPKHILQTGIYQGGSLVFFAHMLDAIKAPPEAKVVGIENDLSVLNAVGVIDHPRVVIIEGDSCSAPVLEQVYALFPEPDKILLSLDSSHKTAHVSNELSHYSPLLSSGGYLVVEDTNINGYPVQPEHGPGPREALQHFIPLHPEFQLRFPWEYNTFSFHSWLERV